MFGKVRARLPLSQHKTSALNLCSLRELDSVPLLYRSECRDLIHNARGYK